MGATTGISWTDATVNFIIGCQTAGRGCDLCYAAVLAAQRFGIHFGPDGERRETKIAFTNPIKWQFMHDTGVTEFKSGKNKDGTPHIVPVPVWVFACSLSDFFDNKWPAGVRERAWAVIKATPKLRYQIVTKRIGNAVGMLPDDWNGGVGYEHVGFIATVVDQIEYDRDAPKLFDLYRHGVKWTGLSIEPQLGSVKIRYATDWIITGGESSQGGQIGRPYDVRWATDLVRTGRISGVPVFVKQLGAQPMQGHALLYGGAIHGKHDNPERWPEAIRVQQMPRVYGD